eukprot:13683769-Ditylum_brightwellii.AAC.1
MSSNSTVVLQLSRQNYISTSSSSHQTSSRLVSPSASSSHQALSVSTPSSRLVHVALQNAAHCKDEREASLQESLERSEEISEDLGDTEHPLTDMFLAEGGY